MRVQARITLPAALRTAIDAARVRWNPEIATGNPAHVTIVYDDEAPDPTLLRARLERACRSVAPFPLRLGAVRRFEPPVIGAFLVVADATDGIAKLRAHVLESPFRARERFGLHVTLLHPAQGDRLGEAWPALSSLSDAGSFPAERVDVVAAAAVETQVLASFELTHPTTTKE
jgi:2'-5' RNA ligase